MESDKDSCERIFFELVTDGAIFPTHAIESSENYTYFHAGLKTIHYNPKMNQLDDSSIKICLLHEEGHIRNQYRTVLFLILLGIISIAIIVVVQANLILKLVLVLSIILISIWWYVLFDEYQSDLFAGRMLKEKFGVGKPSVLLEKTLKKLPSSRLSRITHPSVKQRVKKMQSLWIKIKIQFFRI